MTKISFNDHAFSDVIQMSAENQHYDYQPKQTSKQRKIPFSLYLIFC